MLTPQQVKNHRFQLGSRGTYRAEEVDAFVQELTASFEEAYTQNEALLKKISLLADKVEEYRNFGGIRNEEDYLITETGARRLGKKIPLTPEEVEALR